MDIQENHKEFIRDNKIILKSQQRIRSKKDNAFTEKVNKIAVSANDDKRIQLIDSIGTYAYGTSKNLAFKLKKLSVTI